MRCPEFSEIVDYLEGRLNGVGKRKFENHLATGCQDCRKTMDWFQKFMTTMKSEKVLYDAPENSIQKALSIFGEQKKSVQEWVVAHLQFDSWMEPQMAGIRSDQLGPRHWIYWTDAYKIHVMLDPSTEGDELIGQLAPNIREADVAGCLVELTSKNRRVSTLYTNQNGEFRFTSVPKTFELRIHGTPESVLIPYHSEATK
jgi:hypothetical protein